MASGSYNVSRAFSQAPPLQNQPDNTAFTQQRLPAWQPLLTAGTVLPLFFGLGLAFLAIGLSLFFTSEKIKELELDYTGTPGNNCSNCARLTNSSDPRRVRSCQCGLTFKLPAPFPLPVCLYYQLSNYFQNNRRYSISRDDEQLSGVTWALRHPYQECKPYRYNSQGVPIAPCGSVANSLFNDTFELFYQLPNGSLANVTLDKRGIAWWTDTNVKFQNPEPVNNSLCDAFSHTAKPPFWSRTACMLDPSDRNNTGFVNEEFIVWMRTAALPTFRKLYARIRHDNFSKSLPQGTYFLNISYRYPVLGFHGSKKVILSTLSWMGGKNPFLGIAYLVLGAACILSGIVMTVIHLKYRQQDEEDDDDDD
ncbi:PREDICTED: cell cycle control protein 50B-like [Thamnophis sirtalis]|uniref:Cell cycle control protein n=1 Tax=Thamnophis sirtalis TaxID=35019 RepID=A0A6I9Y5A0_9SAUR|nr:PREDICTED: cell cycle control protein 50B-like [Thamnophis sirtalis]